jgi:hypothetical protein
MPCRRGRVANLEAAASSFYVLVYAKKTLKLIEKIKRGFLLAGRKGVIT